MKYRITIEKIKTKEKDSSYESYEKIYEQITEKEIILKDIIDSFNGDFQK